jgi:NAD(P)-dependent dehydrogenase (short-subunit alcohol dehydrogenase family)
MQTGPLEGHTALVTGASRGIGAATARALDRAGARVAVVSRGGPDLDEVAAALGHRPLALAADLGHADAPGQVAGRVLDEFGSVDVLVNNAALAARLDTVDTEAAMIDELLAVNVRAPLLLTAALVPSMRARGQGSIVNLSSVSGLVGTPRRAAYAASKGALDAATRSLAIELGPSGIRVNSVAPGVVDTALWSRNKSIPGVIERIEGQTPLRRWAQPDDIADVIVFLASDSARFITGETISVDGGMARTLDLFAGPV